jgi:ferric-dicitrate binding protein FerR (iron transport regulator)
MTYRVGQVIFVVLNKRMQVFPMMIVEEIVKRTMHGEEVNYVLQGGTDTSTTILLNKVDGEIFESAEEAKYVLTSRATSQIEKLVDSAVELAAVWYEGSITSLQQDTSDIMTLSQEQVKVTLPDGTIANLKTG